MSNSVIPKTFGELALYWLISYARERKAASSIKRDHGILKNYLLPQFGKLGIDEFTTRDVEFWITNVVAKKIMSKKSANDVLVVLNKILNDAVRWNFLATNSLSRLAKFSIGERDFLFWKLSEVRKFLGYSTIQVTERYAHLTQDHLTGKTEVLGF